MDNVPHDIVDLVEISPTATKIETSIVTSPGETLGFTSKNALAERSKSKPTEKQNTLHHTTASKKRTISVVTHEENISKKEVQHEAIDLTSPSQSSTPVIKKRKSLHVQVNRANLAASTSIRVDSPINFW